MLHEGTRETGINNLSVATEGGPAFATYVFLFIVLRGLRGDEEGREE